MKIIDKEFLKSQKNMEYDEKGNLVINSSLEDALKEIAILKKTNHPNIIRLYEIMYCKKNKKIYLILEHCEHGDLMYYDEESNKFIVNEHILENKNRNDQYKDYYTNKEILKFLNDIISGLYYLHKNGIIHRDIKPNNILLDKNNNCKITDFNVSTILKNLRDDNIGAKICSADHFRPPEACNLFPEEEQKDNIDKEEEKKDYRGKPIDIWALGVTAYILSYNKFPFESETDNLFELYNKISKAEYEIPDYPKRSDDIEKIIKCCLEKDPNNRITIEALSHFKFIDKSRHKSIIKWNSNKKIQIIEKEILNSINFLCPPCVAVFKGVKSRIKKEFDTSKIKYNHFSGKIKFLSFIDKINTSIEEKYGVFVVDGMIFRKEDFGMKCYNNSNEEKKKEKLRCCKFYKKYNIGKSSIV
jgi:serine/threonine protein kinase